MQKIAESDQPPDGAWIGSSGLLFVCRTVDVTHVNTRACFSVERKESITILSAPFSHLFSSRSLGALEAFQGLHAGANLVWGGGALRETRCSEGKDRLDRNGRRQKAEVNRSIRACRENRHSGVGRGEMQGSM
jgi:hypothetical protein